MNMGNATMADMASLMQRVMLDRPVVDQSGLTGRDNLSQMGPGRFAVHPNEPPDSPHLREPIPLPDLVTAFQEQLGLKLESTKAPVDVIVIDKVSHYSEN